MALRGNLKELSLPDIFQLVTFSGKTGVLRIHKSDGAQGSVWFRDGEVFFAQSNWHTEPLGERLVRAQRITPMALDRALELRAAEPEGGKRLGEILVEQGYVTDKVLEAFVQEQIQDTIFDLMRWDDGDFEFEAMPEAPEEDIGLAVSIENVIMEGSRRLEEWNRIKKKIPSTDVVFKMATAPGEGTFEISLKPIEWNLLLLVDGSRSVAELALETSRTDFEVARIFYGLFSAGLLEFATDAEIEEARAERIQREARFAEFEAQQAVRRGAEEAERLQPEPSEAELPEPATLVERAAPSEPAEMPQFLGGEAQAETTEDLSALEAAMGALLSAPTSQAPTPEVTPVVPYTPGEEPAFISASQDTEGATGTVAEESFEELLGDIAGLTPEQPAPEVEAMEVPIAEEPEAVTAPEPELSTAVAAPEPELPMPEPTPVESFEFVPETPPPAEPSPSEPPLEPGTFVVVPAGVTPGVPSEPAEPEVPADWEPPQISFDDEGGVAEPARFMIENLPLVPVVGPEGATSPAPEPVAEPVVDLESFAAQVPEVVPTSPAVPEAERSAEPEPATPIPSSAVPGLQDFEHDLMALGLGELPAELREPEPAEEASDLEPVVEPMGVVPASAPPSAETTEPLASAEETEGAPTLSGGTVSPAASEAKEAVSASGEGVDFSELLESLDISADDAEVTVVPAIEAEAEPPLVSDALLDLEPDAPAGGVISTDAFLDDLTLEGDFGFTGELTDELSALTGADRPSRPSASVHKIPARGEEMLHRDARVDRETLLKIIHGIEDL